MASAKRRNSEDDILRSRKRINLGDVLTLVNDENSDSGSDINEDDLGWGSNDENTDEESDNDRPNVDGFSDADRPSSSHVNNASGDNTSRQMPTGSNGDYLSPEPSVEWTTDLQAIQSHRHQNHNRKWIGNGGPVWQPDDATPVEYFNKFFMASNPGEISLWQLLVVETNKYQQLYLKKNQQLKPNSKVHLWKPVTIEMMKAFIALPSETEPQRGTNLYDPTYKFKAVLDFLNHSWSREYNLHEEISIDESIVGFKGRHILVNYIRIKKHHQWGPKEYVLADTTGYVQQVIYHTKSLRTSNKGQPYDVCFKLMNNHFDVYHHLVVDNYYTSLALCEDMLARGVYVTGTVRSNRKGLPDEMKKVLKKKGDLVTIGKSDASLIGINWYDRKQVRLLSSYSDTGTSEVTKYDDSIRTIPNIVMDYNHGMGGVDLSDMMVDCYSAERKTLKCWKKVVFHLLDRTVNNSYLCYKNNPKTKQKKIMSHEQFIIHLVEGLIGAFVEPRSKMGRPSLVCNPDRRKIDRHFLFPIPDAKRKKCAVCATDRDASHKGWRIRTWCPDCNVGLCIGQCFKDYHT